MSERVRRDSVDRCALLDVFVDHPAHAAGRDPRSLVIKKARLHVTLGFGAATEKNTTGFFEVVHQCLKRGFTKRDDTLLLAFAGNADKLLAKIDVLQIYVHKL